MESVIEFNATPSELSLQVVEKTFHLKITYNENNYFYIIQTIKLPDYKEPLITKFHRGVTYWDCRLKLKNSEKRKINRIIEKYILENYDKHE